MVEAVLLQLKMLKFREGLAMIKGLNDIKKIKFIIFITIK